MARRKILLEGDPILRKKSKPVLVFDKNVKDLFVDMEETLEKEYNSDEVETDEDENIGKEE